MSFSTILFTEKGRALQSKALAGAALIFTRIGMGSGSLGGQSQITLTNLIEQKVSLNITQIKKNGNYATIESSFRNVSISTGFYWREIGIFASDPDIGEILYCYGNAGTLAEYIPPQTSEIIEKVVRISAMVGDAVNISAVIDSAVFATKKDLEDKVDKVNGKKLTTNDFTTEEKEKLSGISEGANKYIHPTASGNKHIPAGGATGQILKWTADGTATWDDYATGSYAGTSAPTNTKVLWIDTSNGVMKYYNGTAWTPIKAVWG